MRRSRRRRIAFFVVFGVVLPLAACGTSAIGVDICNEIEDARCSRAAALGTCGVDFMAPFADATATSSENTAACVRFYSVACLHGLVTTIAPANNTSVNACVSAINSGKCNVVLDPLEAGDACAWLIPPEASPEAEAGDAATDGVVTDVVVTDVNPFSDVILDAGVDADGQMPIMFAR